MSISPAQLKEARRLLGWSQSDLGGLSGVSATTIGYFEGGKRRPGVLDLSLVRRILESAGVEFTNGGEPGVKLSRALR
jgi:transcriptional regulator with XRE-family HTH domain